MQMSILPSDLKQYRCKKILKNTIPFIVLLSISIIACFLLSHKIPSLENATVIKTKAAYIALIALPFIITRFPKKLIDKSWCGEIIDIDTKVYSSVYMRGNPRPYTKASIVLKVKLNNKKIIEAEAFETPEITDTLTSMHSTIRWIPEKGMEQQITNYNAGDKVCHFYLFEHLFVENKKKQTVTCIVCGTIHPQKTTKCGVCNHSILDFDI